MTSESTEQWLVQARAGNRDAWNRLALHYSRRVVVALLADGLPLDVAQELAQQAWSFIWTKHHNGTLSDLQIPGLIIAQARFFAKDRHRHNVKQSQALWPDAESSAAPDRQVIHAQVLQRVQTELQKRSLVQQRIFLAAIVDVRAHEDIARAESLSIQRVRQIIWEVRQSLRASLGPEGIFS